MARSNETSQSKPMSSSFWGQPRLGRHRLLRRPRAPRHASMSWPVKGFATKLQYRIPVHPDAFGDPDGPAPDSNRKLQRTVSGSGSTTGSFPWEYTLGELFADAGYATAAFGKWHIGDIEAGADRSGL